MNSRIGSSLVLDLVTTKYVYSRYAVYTRYSRRTHTSTMKYIGYATPRSPVPAGVTLAVPTRRAGQSRGVMLLLAPVLLSSLAAASHGHERGRPACTAPTPLSKTGPNILLVGDSISMGSSGFVHCPDPFCDPKRPLRPLASSGAVVLP